MDSTDFTTTDEIVASGPGWVVTYNGDDYDAYCGSEYIGSRTYAYEARALAARAASRRPLHIPADVASAIEISGSIGGQLAA